MEGGRTIVFPVTAKIEAPAPRKPRDHEKSGGRTRGPPPALRAESTPLPPRTEALALLYEHVQNPVNRNHAREAEVVMRALAKRLNQDEELWGQTGLLHDIDWEETEELHAEHALRGAKILEQKNYPKVLTAAIRRHNSDLNGSEGPQTNLDYALRCGETVTGLVYAAALVRPDKKLAAVELSSLRKKFKEKSFAAKVNRQTIQECEQLGLNLDEFLALALQAMQSIADEIGV